MLPKIWIFDTYSIMLLIGVVASFILLYFYAKKYQFKKNYLYDLLIQACFSILIGIISATLFQFLFDVLKKDSTNHLGAMTFFGGLVGGVLAFLVINHFWLSKKYPNNKLIPDIITIAPACITIAHAFGRIGCFCAGCCYGKETNSWLGMKFPDLANPVYPTQLFEAIFLFILSAILFYLAYKKKFLFTMPIYLFSYGIWRFLIEFIRGDDRGAFFLGLSPSQWFSICAVIIGVLVTIYLVKFKRKNMEIKEEN